MGKKTRIVMVDIVLGFVFVFFLVPSAYATTTTTPTNFYYTDISKGFRIQVPEGWVVDEVNKTDPSLNQRAIPDYGIEFLIAMCPQEVSLPAPGRLHTCPNALPFTATGFFQLYRFINLQDRPELAALVQQGEPITADDLLALYSDYQRNITFYDPYVYQSIQLVTDEDIQVDVVDPQNNNQTVGAAQAKFVEYTHTDSNGLGSYKQSALLVLSEDANMGYVLRPIVAQLSNQELPGFATQVINSFELIAASGAVEADDAINLE
jgi:hypothetical protein